MTPDEALGHARVALRLWGAEAADPELIRNRENAVFRVTLPGGVAAALRLHRAGYQTDPAIRSELLWTEALAAAGLPCPRPIRTLDGALLGCPAFGPRASVVSWIDAAPIGAGGSAFAGRRDEQFTLYHRLGQLIAELHRITDTVALPADFDRPRWDCAGITGDAPLWGRFWRNPALSRAESDLLDRTRAALRDHLERGTWDMGLIHADLLQENVLRDGARLSLIDFDDSGFGYRFYDLGTALVQHCAAPHRADLEAALCDGYGTGQGEIAPFILARALASAGWIVPRTPKGHPARRAYADRALALARAWMG